MPTYDVIIIGSGAGGGTLAYALKDSGMRVLLIERGDYLPREPQNWQKQAVIGDRRYQADEHWRDADSGALFRPATYYFVGGNTKLYGAAFPRFRREDFGALEHEEGTSPAWPLSYDALEPYYARAEALFRVHGAAGDDPNEPARSGPYPFRPISHEPYADDLVRRLRAAGYKPFALPMGLDLREGGACIRCSTCDGFPCKLGAKSDAEVCCVRPALESGHVTLMTRTLVRRLLTDGSGRLITGVEIERDGELQTLSAGIVVVACGATNSAALLLRSANSMHPNGIANRTDLVGRNYMAHVNSVLIGIDPTRRNSDVFSKTITVNDFYLGDAAYPYPMGNLQILGKIQAAGYIAAGKPDLSVAQQQEIEAHSADWWVMSEDLPDSDNRVMLAPAGDAATIVVRRRFKNLSGHRQLMLRGREMLRTVGYTDLIEHLMPIETNSHQCGTIRFGDDPATSVLDPFCKAWDLDNLYVVDASCFPSSTALNPALTIVALALRVGDKILA